MGRVLIATAAAALALGASDPTASDLNTAGVAQYNAKHYAEAVETFEKAFQSAPDNATVRKNLCNAYQASANELAKSGDYSTAKSQLELAVNTDPENPSPLVQLGAYDLKLELTSEAVFRLEEAIQLDPENIDAHDLLGEAYYRNNDLSAALAHWELVREKQPNRANLQAKIDKASREQSVELNFKKSESRHFKVSYSQGTPAQDLRRVLNTLERAYMEIGRKFSGAYPPGPIQVIVYTANAFTNVTMLGGHIGGLYDGKIRVPLIDASGRSIPDSDLQRVLYHEYTHVVVRHLSGDAAPFWLNEGLAETFSCELSKADWEALAMARNQGTLVPLSSLEGGQIDKLPPDALRLAYLQSHAAVQSLWNRMGANGLSAMMTSLSEGTTPEDALKQTYRRSYDLLEREYINAIVQTASR
ncbi:MAG: tetratricopeptide repeat protein [Candidatus Hydrogenedentes bacterium]|nr:tetratricopeptide repeat protein [Candidatus Hydrogenedentota bacterium]